jgi:carboxypeptidase C (cathepsin A)
LGGLFTENGPFRPLKDGFGLEEHIFSWNRFANVLYIESPGGVGFSQGNPDDTFNDTRTAQDNLLALKEFVKTFSTYSGREFYVTGESYGKIKQD